MASIGRSHNLLVPSGVAPTKAMRRPSGDMTGAPKILWFSGGTIIRRTTPPCGVAAVHFQIARAVTPASKTARTPLTTHGSDTRPARAATGVATAPARELLAATHFN